MDERAPEGILLVDKDTGPTSHDVVARVRRLAGTRKVGHAGTLDPLATGLLVVGVGAATRLLTYVVGAEKEYRAKIRLGLGTTTDDAEGEATTTGDREALAALDEARADAALTALTGDIDQVPSAVSAIKVDGRRAYARVRAGEDVELEARRVTVSAFERTGPLTRGEASGVPVVDVDVNVACSSGTYVRALARDVGVALGTGAHLTALRRTRVGPFAVEDASRLADLDRGADAARAVRERLMTPAAAAVRLVPALELDATAARDLAQGRHPAVDGDVPAGVPLAALGPDGRLIGLAAADAGRLRVLVNLPTGVPGADGGR